MTIRILEIVAEGCMTLSDEAWSDCGRRLAGHQASYTAPTLASAPAPSPGAPCGAFEEAAPAPSIGEAMSDLDAEDRMVCLLTRRRYPDVPERATFFDRFSERLDFYVSREDGYRTVYRSIRWPGTEIEHDALLCHYAVRVRGRPDAVFCTVEEMQDARFSGDLILR
ncbi:MAG: hypothetical protein LBG62_00405 [Candidatus Methanoplasma sp.]|jgi:hypothetical protein|nr:hypothetical protein [Candidatus Methanoplasma sp.]